jgi:hypothetical protein
MESNDGRRLQAVDKILKVSGAEVYIRSHFPGEGNARVAVATSKIFSNAFTDVLLARTSTYINLKIVDGAHGDGMAFCLYAPILADGGDQRAPLAKFTKGQRLRVPRIAEMGFVAR